MVKHKEDIRQAEPVNMLYLSKRNVKLLSHMFQKKREELAAQMPKAVTVTASYNQTDVDKWEEQQVRVELSEQEICQYMDTFAEELTLPLFAGMHSLQDVLPLSDSDIGLLQSRQALTTEVRNVYQTAVDRLYQEAYAYCIAEGNAEAYFQADAQVVQRAYELLEEQTYEYSLE